MRKQSKRAKNNDVFDFICCQKLYMLIVTFAYEITGSLRSAYRPFVYCLRSKTLNTAYQKGKQKVFNLI